MAQEILDTLPALARRLEDVRAYQIPRLAQATTMARDLASEARADLESVRAGLEDARETAELAGSKRDELLSQVTAIEDEWLRCVGLSLTYRVRELTSVCTERTGPPSSRARGAKTSRTNATSWMSPGFSLSTRRAAELLGGSSNHRQ